MKLADARRAVNAHDTMKWLTRLQAEQTDSSLIVKFIEGLSIGRGFKLSPQAIDRLVVLSKEIMDVIAEDIATRVEDLRGEVKAIDEELASEVGKPEATRPPE